MTKLGQKLIKAAREGIAIVRGEAKPGTYRVRRGDQPVFERLAAQQRRATRKPRR